MVIPCGALFVYLLQYQHGSFSQRISGAPYLGIHVNPSQTMRKPILQQNNSIMAIGSGMLQGKGLNNNTLASVKNGNFLSEEQTDFIFAVIGEELRVYRMHSR